MNREDIPSIEVIRHRVVTGLSNVLDDNLAVSRLLGRISSRGKNWGVVGGAPRQWALADSSDLRDLDIVVGMKKGDLDAIMNEWRFWLRDAVDLSTNAFGGYRVATNSWSIDVWPVAETIGLTRGTVNDKKSFRGVAKSAALSLDSIIVTSRQTVYEVGFVRTLDTGILRLNHCSIERPRKVAMKAMALCERYRLTPDLSVQALISSNTSIGE